MKSELECTPKTPLVMCSLHWAQIQSSMLVVQLATKWTSNLCHFRAQDQFLGVAGQISFSLFEISLIWAFQWNMTLPYLMKTHFWSFKSLEPIFGWSRTWVGQIKFFFQNLLLMGFSTKYDTTILNTLIFGHFWVGQEVGEASRDILIQSTSLMVGNYCIQYENMLQ